MIWLSLRPKKSSQNFESSNLLETYISRPKNQLNDFICFYKISVLIGHLSNNFLNYFKKISILKQKCQNETNAGAKKPKTKAHFSILFRTRRKKAGAYTNLCPMSHFATTSSLIFDDLLSIFLFVKLFVDLTPQNGVLNFEG